MIVDPGTGRRGLQHKSDLLAILDDGFVLFQVHDAHLVGKFNVLQQGNFPLDRLDRVSLLGIFQQHDNRISGVDH